MKMDYQIKLEKTADGSDTLFVPSLDEHYHSVNGAVRESNHVFIEAGFNVCSKSAVTVLEVGFGTGLNCFLTLLESVKRSVRVDYATLELHPLPFNIIEGLNYTDLYSDIERALFFKLHESVWEERVGITDYFSLRKIQTDFRLLNLTLETEQFDLIYFDAFAPDKQPEMWSQPILNFLFRCTKKGGILTTYCAKGAVRRMLQTAGYVVERLSGPPGKREMLRAKK